MNSKWTFIGGILAGIAGVFTAAYVATELESRTGSASEEITEQENLALPEGEAERL